jgi:hypothetical protein
LTWEKAAGAGASPGFGHQLEAGTEMVLPFPAGFQRFGPMTSVREIFLPIFRQGT